MKYSHHQTKNIGKWVGLRTYQHPRGVCVYIYIFFFYCACWYLESLLFTNECTSDCLKNNIKIYIKAVTLATTDNEHPEVGVTAPKHVGTNLM